jgi:hypothetical protein
MKITTAARFWAHGGLGRPDGMASHTWSSHEAVVEIPAAAEAVHRLLRTPELLPTVLGRLQNVRPLNEREAVWTLVAPGAPNVRCLVRVIDGGDGTVAYDSADGRGFRITVEVSSTGPCACRARLRREGFVGRTLAERLDALLFVPWLPAGDAARLHAVFA